MSKTDTLNAVLTANNSNCIVDRHHFGSTEYFNICTQHSVTIPWAFGDWAAFGIVSFLLLLLIAAIVSLIVATMDI